VSRGLYAALTGIRNHSSRKAPPRAVDLHADLVFSARLCDFVRAYAGTCGHVSGPQPPAAPKFRFASEPAVPLRVAGQVTACRLWSVRSRRYASGNHPARYGQHAWLPAPHPHPRRVISGRPEGR
jgi:hypothetical protein